jgi:CBS domain-containing protein
MVNASAQQPAPSAATVADIMHPPVTTVEQNDHVAAAAYLMKRGCDRPHRHPGAHRRAGRHHH